MNDFFNNWVNFRMLLVCIDILLLVLITILYILTYRSVSILVRGISWILIISLFIWYRSEIHDSIPYYSVLCLFGAFMIVHVIVEIVLWIAKKQIMPFKNTKVVYVAYMIIVLFWDGLMVYDNYLKVPIVPPVYPPANPFSKVPLKNPQASIPKITDNLEELLLADDDPQLITGEIRGVGGYSVLPREHETPVFIIVVCKAPLQGERSVPMYFHQVDRFTKMNDFRKTIAKIYNFKTSTKVTDIGTITTIPFDETCNKLEIPPTNEMKYLEELWDQKYPQLDEEMNRYPKRTLRLECSPIVTMSEDRRTKPELFRSIQCTFAIKTQTDRTTNSYVVVHSAPIKKPLITVMERVVAIFDLKYPYVSQELSNLEILEPIQCVTRDLDWGDRTFEELVVKPGETAAQQFVPLVKMKYITRVVHKGDDQNLL